MATDPHALTAATAAKRRAQALGSVEMMTYAATALARALERGDDDDRCYQYVRTVEMWAKLSTEDLMPSGASGFAGAGQRNHVAEALDAAGRKRGAE